MQELDRVLDGDDVLGLGCVDAVDHGRERRRLARAGRPGDEDDSALLVGELTDHRRELQLLDGLDLVRDGAQDERRRAALVKGVHAKTREARHREGEVHLVLGLELAAQGVALDQAVDDPAGDLGRERFRVGHGLEPPVDANHRRRGHLEVQVGAV
jgi:hypothetical protein